MFNGDEYGNWVLHAANC